MIADFIDSSDNYIIIICKENSFCCIFKMIKPKNISYSYLVYC